MFSVIIPVHNGEKTLRRCVNSLVPQAEEILLIENGSKDNSRALCHELEREYANVTAIDGDSVGGVSRARNAGLDAATQKYILFCDCDDYVEPDYTDAFRKALSLAEFAVCGYINHDEAAAGRTDIYGFEAAETVDVIKKLEMLHEKCLLQQLWNKVFCRDIIREHQIRFDESISIGEDMRFVLTYLEKACPEVTMLIPKPLYHYMRDQPGSLMYRMGTERMEEAIINLAAMYRLGGLSEDGIEERMMEEREKQKGLYAYLIMHNMGMPFRQRRELILQLDHKQGKQLFWKNLVLFLKEQAVRYIAHR